MTPPKGSADIRGINATVSKDARHKKLLTPIPELALPFLSDELPSLSKIVRPPSPNIPAVSFS
jgi:hypothetical protein